MENHLRKLEKVDLFHLTILYLLYESCLTEVNSVADGKSFEETGKRRSFPSNDSIFTL